MSLIKRALNVISVLCSLTLLGSCGSLSSVGGLAEKAFDGAVKLKTVDIRLEERKHRADLQDQLYKAQDKLAQVRRKLAACERKKERNKGKRIYNNYRRRLKRVPKNNFKKKIGLTENATSLMLEELGACEEASKGWFW